LVGIGSTIGAIMDRAKIEGCELLTLRRMATRLGVPSRWLREQAELGKVPGLRAGNRWLFVPDVASAAVRAMAGDAMAGLMVEINQWGAK
jgi:hypothetical protein